MTACKSTVSGSISLPSRGSFHLSLTVLVHSLLEFFTYRTFTLFGPGFHAGSVKLSLPVIEGPTTPILKRTGLGFSRFARRY